MRDVVFANEPAIFDTMPKLIRGRRTSRQLRDKRENAGQHEPDALGALLGQLVARRGGVVEFARAFKENGGVDDPTLVVRLKSGARPVPVERAAALARTLRCATGERAQAFAVLVAAANLLRQLERHAARKKSKDTTATVLCAALRRIAREQALVLGLGTERRSSLTAPTSHRSEH